MSNEKSGTLYVVATPIGNLQDITLRALETLKSVDIVLAEDTRHAGQLLKHFMIQKPLVSLHAFNEDERIQPIIEQIKAGQSMALVSDAGTPLISDPGFLLVKMLREAGLSVVPIPGPSALIAALSVAGLPTDKFIFEGFLPAKNEARRQRLQALVKETRTLIFYEAPHRLMATLQALLTVFGEERKAAIARELTKIHESVLLSTLPQLIAHFECAEEERRGEIVLLIAGALEEDHSTQRLLTADEVLTVLLAELPLKKAVLCAMQLTGERKNVLYDMALTKKSLNN